VGYTILMLTNYFHDLAVAVLATNVIMIHIIGRYLDEEPERGAILGRVISRLSLFTWWALAYVILAGAVRAWFFMDFEWNPAVEKGGMMIALGVKHVLLVGLAVFGIVGMHRYREKYRDHEG
jgi:hypothetical protein